MTCYCLCVANVVNGLIISFFFLLISIWIGNQCVENIFSLLKVNNKFYKGEYKILAYTIKILSLKTIYVYYFIGALIINVFSGNIDNLHNLLM